MRSNHLRNLQEARERNAVLRIMGNDRRRFVAGAQMANPAIGAAGTPVAQSTRQHGAGGPFVRYARAASRPGYSRSGDAFGANITQALSAAPGYLRWLDCTFVASGGTGTAAVAGADTPFSLISFLQLKDPWGTPLVTGDGYSIFNLLNLYGGQGTGSLYPGNDPAQLDTWSAMSTAGNFTFRSIIPVEGTKGYGVVSIGNSSVLPALQLQLNTAAGTYGTVPTGSPTIATTVDEFYYDVDPTNPHEPPGNGSTFQTAVVQGSQAIGSAASVRVGIPRTGGYITSLIFVLRDSTGARIDWAAATSQARVRLYIDGVPRFDETWFQVKDRMKQFTNGKAYQTGVVAYSFKQSLSQLSLGYLDTLETAMQTNPGTLIEVEMTPWGTIANAPAQLSAIVTQLVPSGPVAQGLPEV
jgi:hypothetical protein